MPNQPVGFRVRKIGDHQVRSGVDYGRRGQIDKFCQKGDFGHRTTPPFTTEGTFKGTDAIRFLLLSLYNNCIILNFESSSGHHFPSVRKKAKTAGNGGFFVPDIDSSTDGFGHSSELEHVGGWGSIASVDALPSAFVIWHRVKQQLEQPQLPSLHCRRNL